MLPIAHARLDSELATLVRCTANPPVAKVPQTSALGEIRLTIDYCFPVGHIPSEYSSKASNS